jgi:hypothetical protein
MSKSALLTKELEPEFIRIADCARVFWLSRRYIFKLIAQGRVVTKLIKEKGKPRGVRLIEVKSLRNFINSFEG